MRIALEAVGWAASSLAGLVVGAWRGGRRSAHHEQKVKDDYNGKIGGLRDEVRKDMASHALKVEEGNDLLVSQFKESFEGLRRQMDDHKLDVERRFFPKDDFHRFLTEYREDQRRTDDKLDKLLELRS